jgi:prevent-host-death family protein
MTAVLSLSEAKARLSEVVSAAQLRGEETVVTVDGEPAARVVLVPDWRPPLTEAEVATFRILTNTILALDRVEEPFDAVELLRDGPR